MNIYFFTTPRNSLALDKLYSPPTDEQAHIRTFLELGYSPLVDSQRDAKDCVGPINGLVWIEGANHLIIVTKNTSIKELYGRVFMLIYFNEEVDYNYLSAAREFFSEILELDCPRRMKTRRMDKEYDFSPLAPQPYLGGSNMPSFSSVLDGKRRVIAQVHGGEREEEVNMLMAKALLKLTEMETAKEIKLIA